MIEDLIKAHVEAFNARHLDALMAGFTDDAVWITGTTTVRGRAELVGLFAGAMKGLLPALTIQNLITSEGQAAAQLTEVYTAGGTERTDHIAGFYLIKEGRIASAKIYREGSANVMQAALDDHYERHPQARPDLGDLAIAAAELDGHPLAGQPARLRQAAAEIAANHPDASPDDVLLWAEARALPAA